MKAKSIESETISYILKHACFSCFSSLFMMQPNPIPVVTNDATDVHRGRSALLKMLYSIAVAEDKLKANWVFNFQPIKHIE